MNKDDMAGDESEKYSIDFRLDQCGDIRNRR